MSQKSEHIAVDILTLLAPPIRLVDWLEQVFEQKRKKGEDVPENFTKWLERWKAIRADGPAVTDGMTQEEWEQLGQKVF